MKRYAWQIMAAVAFPAVLGLAAPEPAIVQRQGDWTLAARFEQPEQIVLPLQSGKDVRFWYMIVTITNPTREDVDFHPRADLMTDTFQIVPAGQGVDPRVFEMIKARHRQRYPFLEMMEKSGNRMLQGEDNTKDIAIIWSDFDPKADGFTIFITGLSNETAVVSHPVAKDEQGQPVQVFLRKTLELRYAFDSDPALRNSLKVVYKGKRWVMR